MEIVKNYFISKKNKLAWKQLESLVIISSLC